MAESVDQQGQQAGLEVREVARGLGHRSQDRMVRPTRTTIWFYRVVVDSQFVVVVETAGDRRIAQLLDERKRKLSGRTRVRFR